MRSARRGIVAAMAMGGLLGPALAHAQEAGSTPDARLTPDVLGVVWPGAERIGPMKGKPPSAPVYQNGEVVGYVYSTLDVVARRGYSNALFDIIGAVDLNGDLKSAKVISHTEPYIVRDPNRQVKLDTLLAGFDGYRTRVRNTEKTLHPDYVSGATVSARAMRAAVIEAAQFVQRDRSGRPPVTAPTLDRDGFGRATWEELLADGSIAHTTISNGAVAGALARNSGTEPETFDGFGPAEETYLDLYAGLLTPSSIGRNVVGADTHDFYRAQAGDRGNMFLVGVKGNYDIRGTAWFKKANGYRLDRMRLVQGETTYHFDRDHHRRVDTHGRREAVRNLSMASVLFLPAESGFDPLLPWKFVLTVHHEDDGRSADADFVLPYELPAKYILLPPPEPEPAWVEAWQEAGLDVGILGSGLVALTMILAFQAPLARRRRLHKWVRNGFLLFVLVWVGWTAGAQLSIINVINYIVAPLTGFNWSLYLAEPLILMIAAYAALSLIVLGRGVFCGWLCPFGALQEFLAQIGRALRLPQWRPAETTQRWLRGFKYVTAVGLIGIAVYSVEWATTMSEIEPFKTAITAGFVGRAAPFVAYAALLLGIGMFVERFYCRFVCPLGGALAILGRLHLVDLLKRRPQCGSSCHLCERSCPINAIDSAGRIDMNECFQCLDCQVEYYDDRRCPPLARNRKSRQRAKEPALGAASVPVAS